MGPFQIPLNPTTQSTKLPSSTTSPTSVQSTTQTEMVTKAVETVPEMESGEKSQNLN